MKIILELNKEQKELKLIQVNEGFIVVDLKNNIVKNDLVFDGSVDTGEDNIYQSASDWNRNSKYPLYKIIFATQNLNFKVITVIETSTVSEKLYLAKKQAEYSIKTNNIENGIHYGEGYKQAKNKFFTKEQVIEAIDMARVSGGKSFFTKYTKDEIIQSIKQPKVEITFDENNKPIKATLL